ncbi:family 43 glycosylhydrolase [Natronospora cellulosivora (SeqCode)]
MIEVIIKNEVFWRDTNGDKISAHGGGIIKQGNFYYWFGENRHGIKKVSCYRSKDLKNWEFRNDVLCIDAETKPHYIETDLDLNPLDVEGGANIERPKVLYNEKSKKYVMWMHYENGKNYKAARAAVAISDTIDGDYTYLGSFRPEGYMSRDCTLFKDDDGTAYFISAARNNADMHIYKLSDDYLSIDSFIQKLWPGKYREAPALVKKDDYYFMMTSGCTGWHPNQGKYAYTKDIAGEWSQLKDIGDETTYDSQSTYILPVDEKESRTYLYIGDRWDPDNYHNSKYIFLKIKFPSKTTMTMDYANEIKVYTKE